MDTGLHAAQREIEDLKARVASLEKRIRELEAFSRFQRNNPQASAERVDAWYQGWNNGTSDWR